MSEINGMVYLICLSKAPDDDIFLYQKSTNNIIIMNSYNLMKCHTNALIVIADFEMKKTISQKRPVSNI